MEGNMSIFRRNSTSYVRNPLGVLSGALALLLIALPASAWKPNQHVALGWAIWNDLLENTGEGKVTINGIRYPVNGMAKTAILNYPIHYLMGCIGPDAYADIYFGQCVVHPDTFWTGDSPHSISDLWLRHILQFARMNYSADGGAALAFAYGFITHAAGDMWCHTFVNRYAGGVWLSIVDPVIPVRHISIEGYVNDLTGSIGTEEFKGASANVYEFQHDSVIHEFLRWTLVRNDYSPTFDSSKFFKFFRDLKAQLVDHLDDDWVENIDDWLPHDLEISTYIEGWISAIDNGLLEWVKTSSMVANSLFFWKAWEQAGGFLQDWATLHLPGMLGAPDGISDLIAKLEELKDEIKMDLDEIKTKLMEDIPALKDLYTEFNNAKDDFRNWLFDQAFGMTYNEFKEYWTNPVIYLTSSDWFGPGITPPAPFEMNTKWELDNELAYSLNGGTFDALKFDASYNTLMMSRLLLLDGPTLNQLLADHGYDGVPLYGPGELEDAQMCAMLGFMRSLDADHQWMVQSPDGEIWGGGMDGTGVMRMWDNEEAREKAFKKIFHLGLDMNIAPPEPLVLIPGTPGILNIEVINTENQSDIFGLSMEWSTPGLPFQVSTVNDVGLVAPGDPQTLQLQITAPRICDFAPGLYSFTLTGESIGRNWLTYDLVPNKKEKGYVRVLPFREVDISIIPESQSTYPAGTRTYALNVANKGNVIDAFILTTVYEDFGDAYFAYPTSLQPSWVSLGPTSMKVPNCGSESPNLSISIPGDWAGMEPTTYRADITAQSHFDSNVKDTVVAAIVVQPTKESKARYVDLELVRLRDTVNASAIDPLVKASLLEKVINAIKKKEQALAYILEDRDNLANNQLNASMSIVEAFIDLVEAQNGKSIPQPSGDGWINSARSIVSHIIITIDTL